MWAEACLRHTLQEREVQAMRPDRKETKAVCQDAPGRRQVEEGRKSTGDNRED